MQFIYTIWMYLAEMSHFELLPFDFLRPLPFKCLSVADVSAADGQVGPAPPKDRRNTTKIYKDNTMEDDGR